MGNVTGSVATRCAFFPPEPPTYEILKGPEGDEKLILSPPLTGETSVEVHKLDTKGGNKIVAIFWKHPFARFTLLYSHGNAADLGQMIDLFVQLRAHLRVNIMRSLSRSLCIVLPMTIQDTEHKQPTEPTTFCDIEAVFNCLTNQYGIKQEELILYGQSVGSGPTVHLASKSKNLRAVLLHSAILSGLRVLYPVKMTFWFDIFKNIDKIRHVDCPVLVIHGTSDDIVDWSHGKRLWELSKEKYEPLWVKGGSYCNLESFPEYLNHMRRFLNALEKLSITGETNKQVAGQTKQMFGIC